jgi:hypothetical protein
MPEGPAVPASAPQASVTQASVTPASVTAASALAGPGAPAASQSASLLATVRDALRDAAGRVALRVPSVAPHRRRVARALLQEGALAAGGVVVDGPADDLLLVGAEAGRAERLRRLLDRLLGNAGTATWSLERDAAALLRYAGGGAPPPPVAAPSLPPGPDLPGLDAWLRAVPLAHVVRRQVGAWLDPAEALRPAFLRIEASRAALATLLGPLGQDRDLLDHAVQGIGPRLLKAMGDPAQFLELLGDRLAGALHLPVPTAQIEGRAATPAGGVPLVATVRLEEAAAPGELARRQAMLARLGWGMEIDGLDAASLALVVPDALPVDVIRLHWSRALASAALTEAVRRIDPSRVILSGVEDGAALAWARGVGLQRAEGTLIDATLLAQRRIRGFGSAEKAAIAAVGQGGAPALAAMPAAVTTPALAGSAP